MVANQRVYWAARAVTMATSCRTTLRVGVKREGVNCFLVEPLACPCSAWLGSLSCARRHSLAREWWCTPSSSTTPTVIGPGQKPPPSRNSAGQLPLLPLVSQ